MDMEERLAGSTAARGRHELMAGCVDRLMHKAHRALDVLGMDPMAFVVVCIAVDSRWRPVVDELMPDNEVNWQAERERGAVPVAMGIVMREGFQDRVVANAPELVPSLATPPGPGLAHLVVLDDTGGTVYDVPAREHVPH